MSSTLEYHDVINPHTRNMQQCASISGGHFRQNSAHYIQGLACFSATVKSVRVFLAGVFSVGIKLPMVCIGMTKVCTTTWQEHDSLNTRLTQICCARRVMQHYQRMDQVRRTVWRARGENTHTNMEYDLQRQLATCPDGPTGELTASMTSLLLPDPAINGLFNCFPSSENVRMPILQ